MSSSPKSLVIKLFFAAIQIIAALSVDNFGEGNNISLFSFSAKIINFSLNLEFAITPPPPEIVGTFVSFTAFSNIDIKESTIAS